jgi:hypothetical protein
MRKRSYDFPWEMILKVLGQDLKGFLEGFSRGRVMKK